MYPVVIEPCKSTGHKRDLRQTLYPPPRLSVITSGNFSQRAIESDVQRRQTWSGRHSEGEKNQIMHMRKGRQSIRPLQSSSALLGWAGWERHRRVRTGPDVSVYTYDLATCFLSDFLALHRGYTTGESVSQMITCVAAAAPVDARELKMRSRPREKVRITATEIIIATGTGLVCELVPDTKRRGRAPHVGFARATRSNPRVETKTHVLARALGRKLFYLWPTPSHGRACNRSAVCAQG